MSQSKKDGLSVERRVRRVEGFTVPTGFDAVPTKAEAWEPFADSSLVAQRPIAGPYMDREWLVTHRATGCIVAHGFWSRRNALTAAEWMARRLNWSMVRRPFPKRWTEQRKRYWRCAEQASKRFGGWVHSTIPVRRPASPRKASRLKKGLP